MSKGVESLEVVPWSSREEWDSLCTLVQKDEELEAISKLEVWKARVPSLPLGAEVTLLTLKAKVSERQDHSASLYSLALIRFINQVGHLAATNLGETVNVPARELTASLGVPDWIVSLRNELNHGVSPPTPQLLNVAGDYILGWLKENYWKCLPVVENYDEESLRDLISAFVAARVYQLREVRFIDDPEILNKLDDSANLEKGGKVKAAVAGRLLKSKILRIIKQIPMQFLGEGMIPPADFYEDVKRSFEEPLRVLTNIWRPVTQILLNRRLLPDLLLVMGEIHVEEDVFCQEMSACWISHFLQVLREAGKSFKRQLHSLLRLVMQKPNEFTRIFWEDLLEMLHGFVEEDVLSKCDKLAGIWMSSGDMGTGSTVRGRELFTVDSALLDR